MNLTYNGFAIHDLGEFTVAQSREYEDGGARARVSLKIGVTVFERSYADNYALVQGLRDALRSREGVLVWTNTETSTQYVNRTVTLSSEDLPEEWGTYQMQLNLVFTFYEQDAVTQNMALTFTPNGGAPVTLGEVTRFGESVTIERPSPFQSGRTIVRAVAKLGGLIRGDTRLSLAERRAALSAQEVALRTALSAKDGLLAYGEAGASVGAWTTGTAYTPGQWVVNEKVGYKCAVGHAAGTFADDLAAGKWTVFLGPQAFYRTVRTEELTVDLDQAKEVLTWSFTAYYNIVPDEATGFTITEFSVDQRDANTGEQFMTVSGRIQAINEGAARTQLGVILGMVLGTYASGQQLRNDSGTRQVNTAGDGLVFVELSFQVEYKQWRSDNLSAQFTKTGAGAAVSFGQVEDWELHYSGRRFNDLRSQRQRGGGMVNARGVWKGDGSKALGQRRAELLARVDEMTEAVNGADGLLEYGGFSQVVRIEDFRAEINQAITGVKWSFTAAWSLFPDESGYATCDFTVGQNSNAEDGEETLTFSGTILAPDEALARAKLGALRTAMLAQYAYSLAQQLRPQSTVRSVYANGDKTAGLAEHEAEDGTTFIELSFSEEYRRRRANLVSWTEQSSSRSDNTSGLIVTNYSGSVVASGASADAAYGTALAKAQELGAGMEAALGGSALLRSSQINWEKRQVQAANSVEFVRLTYAYEYQSKVAAGNGYLEVNTETNVDTFGTDAVTVSGYVVAATAAAALTLYNSQVRGAYAKALVHAERTSQSKVSLQKDNGFTSQELRLDFSFTVFSAKGTGTVNYRYGMTVSNDYLQLLRTTRVRGSVYAKDEATAATAVTALLTRLAVGSTQTRDERSVDHEYTSESGTDAVLKYDFENEYQSRITGVSGVLEMRVTETVRYSGVRWIVQPIPRDGLGGGGVSIVQDGGIEVGARTVRGSVSAATKTTALTTARAQRLLLTGDSNGRRYPQPQEEEVDYEWVARTDGVVTGNGVNVRLYRASFTYTEILPFYPPVN